MWLRGKETGVGMAKWVNCYVCGEFYRVGRWLGGRREFCSLRCYEVAREEVE